MFTYLLIALPLVFALTILKVNQKTRDILSIVFVLLLALISLANMATFGSTYTLQLPHFFHSIFTFLDILVLSYFLLQGFLRNSALVKLLAFTQIILYAFVVFGSPALNSSDILVDNASSIMYLVINIVGGAIILYALKYIESENFDRFRKNSFIAMLFFFLAVMNFIVSTNNIEIFFLLFELTTLCSYILIGYRKDEISTQNSVRALWMNQVGGVAILTALIFSITQYNTVNFDILISNIDEAYLIPIVFLAVAAFVKGATIPFEKWLLGAMVAPTPVSAILHSATMVKIAPYLMLKLAPAMSGFVSLSVTLIGTFVFFAASLLALSKDYFKEILGLSTIALLALMMALAAIGTQEAITAALIFIVFHAISKALLFLQAGILEKESHLKYVEDINGLINHSPLVTFFIIVGFASLTLPPFGAFIAKFMVFEALSEKIVTNPLYVIALIFVALGSVFLTLLYFKVVTKLLAKDEDSPKIEKKPIPKLYTIPSYALLILLIIGIFVSYKMDFLSGAEIIVPTILIAVVPALFTTLIFKNATRVKEYYCGEKDEIKLSMFYFNIDDSYKKIISTVAIVAILALIIGVM
ncbi:MAG: proton-conducting transporter membrane subunit [Campylobacterota bacterium]|nr:proton-conducting transporter membrane subunit [Campylobacterota bacterium]